MFEPTFVEGKTKKTWTVLVAFLAQTAFLIIAVILPMIYFDVLPKTQLTSFLVAPPPPPPPPPPVFTIIVTGIDVLADFPPPSAMLTVALYCPAVA